MSEKRQSSIKAFLIWLSECVKRNDRGLLADLRHGFSHGTEYRAWPHIAKWCDLQEDSERCIWITVAAGFATHKKTVSRGNMGATMRQLALTGSEGKADKCLASFDGRFRRLLTCSSPEEVCRHLHGIIRVAERKNVGINFEQLFWDLMKWNRQTPDVRVLWASQYWDTELPAKGGAPQ